MIKKFNKIFENNNSFIIPEAIMPNYKNTTNLNAKDWKAKIIVGNSMGKDNKVGDWDDVGYILVSINSNVIIPVARSDEHRVGYDLLEYLVRKNLVPDENYISVYNGSNYIWNWDIKTIDKYKVAVKKLLSYGLKLNMWFEITDYNILLDADDFLKIESPVINKQELAPFGKKFISELEEIALLYRSVIERERSGMHVGKMIDNLFQLTYNFLMKFQNLYRRYINIWDDKSKINNIEDIIKSYNDYYQTQDYEGMMGKIFSMNGIKNIIHMQIKKAVKDIDKNGDKVLYKYRDYLKFFGNMKIAFAEFNRLGDI